MSTKGASLTKETTSLPVIKPLLLKHKLFEKSEVFLKKSRTACFSALHFQEVANFIWYLQGNSAGKFFDKMVEVLSREKGIL